MNEIMNEIMEEVMATQLDGYANFLIKDTIKQLKNKGKAWVFLPWQKDLIINQYPFITFEYKKDEGIFYLYCKKEDMSNIK